MGNGLMTIDIFLPLDPFRRDLERPGKNDGKRKANCQCDQPHLDRPCRRFKSGQNNRGRLDEEPANDSVSDRDLANIAAL